MSAQPEPPWICEGTFDLGSVNPEAPLTLRPLTLASRGRAMGKKSQVD